MVERWQHAAESSLVSARNEAVNVGATFISTEHLLVGLLTDPHSSASRALIKSGLSLKAARAALPFVHNVRGIGHLPHSPVLTDALTCSAQEAARLQSPDIGPEHLLLGLLDADDGGALSVLSASGIHPQSVRTLLLDLLILESEIGAAVQRHWAQCLAEAFGIEP